MLIWLRMGKSNIVYSNLTFLPLVSSYLGLFHMVKFSTCYFYLEIYTLSPTLINITTVTIQKTFNIN